MTELAQFEGARNLMLKDVTLQYTKLSKLVEFSGNMQWETSIITEDADQAEEWANNHLNVKPNSAMKPTAWTVSLNRKEKTSDGTMNAPVRLVHNDKTPFTDLERRQIGNGSKGNVIIWQGHYDNSWGKGVSSSLTAIQVTDLVVYEGGIDELDFENLGSSEKSDDVDGAEKKDLF